MKISKSKKITTLIFDLGNVLVYYDNHIAAKRFAKECRIPLMRLWFHFFTSPLDRAITTGRISPKEFYRRCKRQLKIDLDYSTFCRYWNDIFWRNPSMECFLLQMKKRYPLYLISNTNRLHFEYIRNQYPILQHFKRTFPSHVVGVRKPDPEIYRYVLRKIKKRPEETVYIDDVSSFVRGARQVGMNAIRFRNKKQLIKDLKVFGVRVS